MNLIIVKLQFQLNCLKLLTKFRDMVLNIRYMV